MAVYFYRAENIEGIELKGKIECKDEKSLYLFLRNKGYYLMNWKKEYPIKLNKVFNKISKKELAILCKQLSLVTSCGINITDALEMLSKQSANIVLRDSLKQIRREVETGESLADSFEMFNKNYPSMMINMIRIGEEGGNLDVVLISLSNYFEREDKMIKKIKAALAYPTLLFIVTLSVSAFLMLKIVPSFASTLTSMGQKIPPITMGILNISLFLKGNLLILFLFLILFIIAIRYFFKSKKGKEVKDRLLLETPIFKKIYKKYIQVRFIRSMTILLDSGNIVIKSLQLAKLCTENNIIKEEISSSIDEMMKGKSTLEALRKVSIFDSMVLSMIAVGEETGNLAEMFKKSSEVVDEEFMITLDKATTLLEPIMIVFLAIIIGVIILSIMLPIFNIMDSMK